MSCDIGGSIPVHVITKGGDITCSSAWKVDKFPVKGTEKGGVISCACNEPHRDLILYTKCSDTGFYSAACLVKG
nr:hypothetical protein Puna18p_00078 [Serratia proteamaculans]